jgi:type VI secretion system protein ImpF
MSTLSLYDKLSRRSSRDPLCAAVGRDLVDLMNCALRGARIGMPDDCPAARSVLNYGCPPLSISDTAHVNPARIVSHICEVMRRFEPRVDMTRTRVQIQSTEERNTPYTLYFEILTQARESGRAFRVALAFDYLNGIFSLPGDDRMRYAT